jgi:hypothetical protein
MRNTLLTVALAGCILIGWGCRPHPGFYDNDYPAERTFISEDGVGDGFAVYRRGNSETTVIHEPGVEIHRAK